MTGTWNTAGVVDAAFKMNITNSASGAGSKLIDLQVGGSTEFNVDVAGNGVLNGSLAINGGTALATTNQNGTGNLVLTTGAALVSPTITTSFTPTSAAGSDLGSTALPFANIWFGTAATNNFKLIPAATAAARTITYNDPLANSTASYVIAKGTTSLTSGSVSGATCQTTVTTSATGAATTDEVIWSYATAPTVTTDGLLHTSAYTTSGNVGFTRCNPTAGSITGTAIVVNWAVIRTP